MIVVTGHFGSGKTEFAINLALDLKKQGKSVTIVDFDIVNPYFRTADVKEFLKQNDISVIVPDYANTNIDLPSLSGQIYSIFSCKTDEVIVDVGGDDDGAIVLGRFKKNFDESEYKMYLVFNSCRPLTSTAEEIVQMAHEIESKSRLKITGLVNSTNLSHQTTPETIFKSFELATEVSKKLGVDVEYVCVKRKLYDQLKDVDKIFPIDIYMKKY